MNIQSPAKAARGAQISMDRLMDRAREAAGLSDFGDPWFRAPLGHLVQIINDEAGLVSDDAPPVRGLVANLADRLRLVDYLKRHPEVRKEKLDVAGVIIGLPRGGSTLLQRLLSTSPQLTSTYRQAIQMFTDALHNMIAVRRKMPASRFIDLRYQDVIADPLGQFRHVMQQMGFIVGKADQQAASTWMAQNGRDTHPRHQYKAEDYGITDAQIAAAFKFYGDAFLKASD